MARAMWKAKLKIGSTSTPVALYSAVVDRTVRFHILDERSMSRVEQHMVNPETGKVVPNEEIQKGYEIEPGKFVVLTEEELERLKPEPSREIEIIQFIPPDNVDSQWYERPYYLGPDGDSKNYFALADALAKQGKVGIAQWVMRDKEYVGELRSQDGYLMLVTLKHPEEVISAEELPAPGGRALDKKELNMAKQLVQMLEGEFNPAEMRNEYREQLTEFIETKAKGKAPKLRSIRAKKEPTSLTKVLSKSLETLKKEKEAA